MRTVRNPIRWLSPLLVAVWLGLSAAPAQAQPVEEWLRTGGGSADEKVAGIVVNSAGEVYVAGTFRGAVDFDPGPGSAVLNSFSSAGYIVKYSPQGAVIWAKSIQGTEDTTILDIGIDPNDNLVLTGGFEDKVDLDPGPGVAEFSSSGSTDLYLVQLDTSGNFNWGFKAGDSDSDSGNGLTVRDDGQIYVTGNFEGNVGFDTAIGRTDLESADEDDVIVLRFFSDGALQWAKAVGGDDDDEGRAIAVDRDGSTFIAGVFEDDIDLDPGFPGFELSSAGRDDIFITKLADGGDWRAGTKIGGLGDDRVLDMTIDPQGNLYLVGSFEREVDFDRLTDRGLVNAAGDDDIFLAKYDRNLNFLWVDTFGSGRSDIGAGIALDSIGNVYITGNFEESVDFEPGPGVTILTSTGEDDGFLAKYHPTGALDRVQAIRGPLDQAGRGVTVDRDGNVYAAGIFRGSVALDLGDETVTGTGGESDDLFVAKFGRPQWTPNFTRLFLPWIAAD